MEPDSKLVKSFKEMLMAAAQGRWQSMIDEAVKIRLDQKTVNEMAVIAEKYDVIDIASAAWRCIKSVNMVEFAALLIDIMETVMVSRMVGVPPAQLMLISVAIPVVAPSIYTSIVDNEPPKECYNDICRGTKVEKVVRSIMSLCASVLSMSVNMTRMPAVADVAWLKIVDEDKETFEKIINVMDRVRGYTSTARNEIVYGG